MPEQLPAVVFDINVYVHAILSNDTDLTSISPWHGPIPILRPRDFVARTLQTRRRR
jgi:hypothetical protein